MSGNGQTHPGRSVDFLSRLHDGELSAGERARFEAHRAHCAECRRAALEFQDALSLFRSTRSNPPRSDLAARILRKVQSTNRPRAPFPRRFQIDLGWAALLLTALFAILITPSLVVRRTPATAPAPEVSPPSVAAETGTPAIGAPIAPPRVAENRQRMKARAASPRVGATEPPSENLQIAQREEAASRDDRPEREAVIASGTAPLLEGAPKASAASAGGEGDTNAVGSVEAKIHLSITSIDGFGPAPALLSDQRMELADAERGRSYIVLVDAQGSVRRVSPEPGESRRMAAESPASTVSASNPLSGLRFEPGNRPRRLLVRLR